MGQNIDIGTISGMTAEEILDMMATKKIGINDQTNLAIMMQTISTEWGSESVIHNADKNSQMTLSTSSWFTMVDSDFRIEGTNGYNKRIKFTSHGTGTGGNMVTYPVQLQFTLTVGDEIITEIVEKSSLAGYTFMKTIKPSETIGIVTGHIKIEVKKSTTNTQSSNTQYYMGCKVFADTYA